jgi:radical SAM superfamily enzyme YgiQ (UPF0313 family)
MKPRILLIAPTALDYHAQPIKKKKLYLPGLTLISLASITPPEFDLTLVSETVTDIPFDEKWDLVGLTGMGSGIKRAWQIGDEFRKRKVPVVIGGIAASLAPASWTLEHADYLVTGEAEDTWPRFLNDFYSGRAQREYKMVNRPDIAGIPLPRYDLMPRSEQGLWRPVQATRGCPFPCDFCSIQSYYERGYRKRPVDQILRDVRAAKKTGSRYITFIDDNIGVDWKFFKELMTALIDEKIFWASQCSLHIAEEPEMLELAFKSGCRILSFGIESVNPGSVAAAYKTFNHPENYSMLLRRVREAGIAVSTEMIVGMEEDTTEVFDATYEFLIRNQVPLPRVYIMTPVPGTGLYKRFEEEERIFDYDIANYNGGKCVFRPRKMSAETLNANYWKLYDKIYSHGAILKRMRGVPKQTELKLRTFIYGTNLHYRSHVKQRITPGIV